MILDYALVISNVAHIFICRLCVVITVADDEEKPNGAVEVLVSE